MKKSLKIANNKYNNFIKKYIDSPLRGYCMNNLGGDSMYKIGDFSKMSKVTIKALRYYEKEGSYKLFLFTKKALKILWAPIYIQGIFT